MVTLLCASMNIDFACDRFNVAREVPLLINEAQRADPIGNILLTRFLHNKLTFNMSGYFECYTSYLSPESISKVFTLFGLFLFLIGLYYLVKNKRWLLAGTILIGPALPLLPLSFDHRFIAGVMYLPQLLMILIGLVTGIEKLFSLTKNWQQFFPSSLYKNALVNRVRQSLPILGLLALTPLFFYNLGVFGLADFDEGWYAGVASDLLKRNFTLPPMFNGVPFFDHPPFGFVLMALSFFAFGVNEFSARFPSAAMGIGCLFLIYFIGKKLFSGSVGFMSALMLSSSVWFVLRARSGNLDVPFLFFYLLTFLAALLSGGSIVWSVILGISFSLLFLTKSMIGLTILPAVVLLLLANRSQPRFKTILIVLAASAIPISVWVIMNLLSGGDWTFFSKMVANGSRAGSYVFPNLPSLLSSTTMNYLHYGMGRWYYFSLLGLVLGLSLLVKDRRLTALYSVVIILFVGFLANSKTEIWHLLPLYPFLFILASAVFQKMIGFAVKLFRINVKESAVTFAAVLIVLFFAGSQVISFANGVHLFDNTRSDLSVVAQKARHIDGPIYLDGHDFFPSTVFYSGRNVQLIRASTPPKNSLKGVMDYEDRPLLVITEYWRLRSDEISSNKYDLLEEQGEVVLLRLKNK